MPHEPGRNGPFLTHPRPEPVGTACVKAASQDSWRAGSLRLG